MKVKKLLLTHTTKNYYNVAPICPPYSPPSQHWPIQSPPYILVLYKFGFHLMIAVLIQYKTKMKLRRQRKNQWCVFVPNWLKNSRRIIWNICRKKTIMPMLKIIEKQKKNWWKMQNSWRGISVCIAFVSVA